MMLKRGVERCKAVFQDQAGEGIISALYTMLLLTVIFFVGIDIAGYTGMVWKVRNACNETLPLMKIENGFDSNTEHIFYQLVQELGLDPARVRVSGTPKPVQRGDKVVIRAETSYVLTALRPFGRELSFAVRVEMAGLAQDFLREE